MLRATIAGSVPAGGHVLDLGAGDGQTFALVADAVPAGTTISFEEPNAHYVADYRAMLASLPHLKPGMALAAGFDEIDAAAQRSGVNLPDDGSIDLVLALHMIFFLADLRAGLTRMARFLNPGGGRLTTSEPPPAVREPGLDSCLPPPCRFRTRSSDQARTAGRRPMQGSASWGS